MSAIVATTTAVAAPLALIRVYIRNMVVGKRYLVRTRDLDTQIYNGDVYATFKGRLQWSNETDKNVYLEEFIAPDILQELKSEFEVYKLTEDTDIENPMSLFSFVMSVELGIGFVFQHLLWGSSKDTGFFEDIEGDVYEGEHDNLVQPYLKYRTLGEDDYRFYEVPEPYEEEI